MDTEQLSRYRREWKHLAQREISSGRKLRLRDGGYKVQVSERDSENMRVFDRGKT